MPLSSQPLLAPDQRSRLAARPGLGGGNLLTTALAAHTQPDVPFIRSGRPLVNTAGGEQTEFSLRQLDQLAQSWSVWYHSHGVRPRDRVAIYLPDSFAYSVHFYALAQLGAIPVLINSKAPKPIALGLCERTSPVGIYTDRAHLSSLGEEIRSLADLRWVQLAEELPAPPSAMLPEGWRFRHAAEDPVSIMHSSGTTGRPKAVIQTHASSVAGPRYRLINFSEPTDPLMMTAQPQSHLGCIVYTTYAILAGTPLVALYDPSGDELAAALQQHRPKTVMAFAHAYAELAALDVPDGAIDSVDRWITMGDAIHEAHIRAILAKRNTALPPATFYDRFGTTELGWGLVVQPRTLSSTRSDRRVGKPDAVAEVAVLHRDGSRAALGEVGFFGAKGPNDHRRVLERLRRHLPVEAGRLLADRRPGVSGHGRQLLPGGPRVGCHRDRGGRHRLFGPHGGDAAERHHRDPRLRGGGRPVPRQDGPCGGRHHRRIRSGRREAAHSGQ